MNGKSSALNSHKFSYRNGGSIYSIVAMKKVLKTYTFNKIVFYFIAIYLIFYKRIYCEIK